MFQFQRGLVHHQTRRDVGDMFNGLEIIGFQRPAAAHQIDDRVRQPHQRRQLHRAIQLDQVHMHAFCGEVRPGGLHIFGRHAQPRTLAHRRFVIEIVAHRHHHPAPRNVQVQRLIQPGAAVLVQHILARHADVRRAVLHVGRHVAGAHDDQAHIGTVGRQDQLARRLRVFQRDDARRFQQRQGFFEDAAFGQRDGDHLNTPKFI